MLIITFLEALQAPIDVSCTNEADARAARPPRPTAATASATAAACATARAFDHRSRQHTGALEASLVCTEEVEQNWLSAPCLTHLVVIPSCFTNSDGLVTRSKVCFGDPSSAS